MRSTHLVVTMAVAAVMVMIRFILALDAATIFVRYHGHLLHSRLLLWVATLAKEKMMTFVHTIFSTF